MSRFGASKTWGDARFQKGVQNNGHAVGAKWVCVSRWQISGFEHRRSLGQNARKGPKRHQTCVTTVKFCSRFAHVLSSKFEQICTNSRNCLLWIPRSLSTWHIRVGDRASPACCLPPPASCLPPPASFLPPLYELVLKSMWDRCESNVKSIWHRCDIDVSSLWNRCETFVNSSYVDVQIMRNRCLTIVKSM